MKLPEIPDLTAALELMGKSPPIKLAPGDKFVAQLDSVVMPAEVSKATGALLLALLDFLPNSFEAIEEALSAMLEPITEEEKEMARKLIIQIRATREGFQTGFAKGFGQPL
jgi:hypothetical protein